MKNINKTLGKITQQSKRPLQGNGMAARSHLNSVKPTKGPIANGVTRFMVGILEKYEVLLMTEEREGFKK